MKSKTLMMAQQLSMKTLTGRWPFNILRNAQRPTFTSMQALESPWLIQNYEKL